MSMIIGIILLINIEIKKSYFKLIKKIKSSNECLAKKKKKRINCVIKYTKTVIKYRKA